MRRVTAPDGREWKIGRQWLPATRVRVRPEKGDGSGDPSGFLEGVGDFFGVDDAGAGIVVGFVLLALAALVFLVVFPVVALTLELIILLVLFLAGIVSRVVFRRPWHVLARSGGAHYRWAVRGWRASGAMVGTVADSLAVGSIPPGAEIADRRIEV